MKIEETYAVMLDKQTCAEHNSPADYALTISGITIPLCITCLKELREEIDWIIPPTEAKEGGAE